MAENQEVLKLQNEIKQIKEELKSKTEERNIAESRVIEVEEHIKRLINVTDEFCINALSKTRDIRNDLEI